MDYPPLLRPQPPSGQGGFSLPLLISCKATSDPISTTQPWQSCAPVIRRARQNRKLASSKNWSAESATCTQLVPLGYIDGMKLDLSTLTVPFIGLHRSSCTQANETGPPVDSFRKSIKSPIISRLPIPSAESASVMHGFSCALTSNRIWKYCIGSMFDFFTATAVLVDSQVVLASARWNAIDT
jgi:hypothetical protein